MRQPETPARSVASGKSDGCILGMAFAVEPMVEPEAVGVHLCPLTSAPGSVRWLIRCQT